MPDPRSYVAGSSSLVLGCDSYTSPAELGDTEYLMGQNVVCRGGILQTRPGTRTLFCLPDGNFQGCTLFTPANGVAHLVFAVNGAVYVSAAPFTSYRRLWDLQFSLTARFMAWAVCLKSTDYDNEGNLIFLDNPYSVLVMQDGLTRAAYWDGSTAAHINPAPAPDNTDTPVIGYQGTPIGLWMIWSGNRLWVSRGNQIFASDIGNPLKFTESQYLNEGRAFYLTGPCTGMIEVPSGQGEDKGFIAFTETDGTLFQSYIQNRTDWLSTPLFQNTILPNIGCVAPRSLITQYGLNWWFSARGLTNLNAAFRQNLSSRIDYQDNQMFSSKAYLSPDLSGVCGSYYENYLMMSVPSGDVLNRHTWVLDQAPMEGNANAWTGFWTGWRPIEWCRGIVNGDERIFFGSVDYDGKNRIWEGMLAERKDNGCAITCYAQLRDHAAGNLEQKRYEWSKFFLSQILGEVHLNVYVAATKGGYQLQKQYKIVATEGQIYADTEYSESGPLMVGNRVQSRIIRTPADPDDDECNSCGVESKEGNKIDYAFSHLLVWSGQMGIRAYQMHMRESPERKGGDCEEPEEGPRVLNAQGCSGLSLFVDGQPFQTYSATAEGLVTLRNGGTAYVQRTVVSGVSQEDAQRRAECAIEQIGDKLANIDVSDISCIPQDGGTIGGDDDMMVISGPVAATPPCPVVETQPVAESIVAGDNANFFVTASSVLATFQWQVSTNGGGSWANISDGAQYSGTATSSLTVLSATAGMNGYLYRCAVGYSACSIDYSESAELSVLDPFSYISTWTPRTTPAVVWNDVTWSQELGLFVAVGFISVMTSPDGVTWTSRTCPGFDWQGVTWSPERSLFVAVGVNGCMTSPNGITWTSRTCPANTWRDVAWSPTLGIFAAVGNSAAMSSPDGITWTSRTIAANSWRGITWGAAAGVFVAVSSSGATRCATSANGTSWTNRTIPAADYYDVAWSPDLSLFVAVASNAVPAKSSDGITWSNTGSPGGGGNWLGVAWSAELGIFCAVQTTQNPNSASGTSDATTWQSYSTPYTTRSWTKIAWGSTPGVFVAVSPDGSSPGVLTSIPFP